MNSKQKTLILTSFLSLGLLLSIYATSAATTKTLYSWVKDAAGNISTSLSDTVDITLPDEPTNIYYISPSGNDTSGTGTTINPWASLYKACNSVTTSGSTIHVKAGTYIETLPCDLAVGVNLVGVKCSYCNYTMHIFICYHIRSK